MTCLQDLFASNAELDHELDSGGRRDVWQNRLLKLFLAGPLSVLPHSHQIARGRPMKPLWYRGSRENMQHDKSCSEMVCKGRRVWQCLQGCRSEVRG